MDDAMSFYLAAPGAWLLGIQVNVTFGLRMLSEQLRFSKK